VFDSQYIAMSRCANDSRQTALSVKVWRSQVKKKKGSLTNH